MKKAGSILFAFCFSLGVLAQQKPNIIYIYADDLGYGELGCYGQQKINTPNLDKIARIPRMGYNHVIVWLDHDKYKEALNIEHKLNFVGITTDIICTDLDPKCYTSDIIKNRMNVL